MEVAYRTLVRKKHNFVWKKTITLAYKQAIGEN